VITRFFIMLVLFASAAAGAGVGLIMSQVTGRDDRPQDVKSITGVSSGVDGTQVKPPEKKGVDQVAIPPEPPATTHPTRKTDAKPVKPQSQAVDLQGVKGTEGVATESKSTIEFLTTNDPALQSIRGIKGIDTVMLQNLEAVLRMQAPPPPPESGGAVRAAAALLTTDNDAKPGPETETDDRKELMELELEGS
jgi:hypothetical protein